MFDVHVRLRPEQLSGLQVGHIHSEVETSDPEGALAGYTEWRADDLATPGARALSFGWDWTYERATAQLHAHWAELRTNLMIVDAHGHDLGLGETTACVQHLMAGRRWDRVVAAALQLALRDPPP